VVLVGADGLTSDEPAAEIRANASPPQLPRTICTADVRAGRLAATWKPPGRGGRSAAAPKSRPASASP
jgi:hypothetical protein